MVLSYVHKATNHGPNPALPPRVRDTLPPGATLLSAVSGVRAGLRQPGNLPPSLATAGWRGWHPDVRARAGGLRGRRSHAHREPRERRERGAPRRPGSRSRQQHGEVRDRRGGHDASPAHTLRVAVGALAADPTLVPITVTVKTTDACDDNPTIRLVSITSNEAADARARATHAGRPRRRLRHRRPAVPAASRAKWQGRRARLHHHIHGEGRQRQRDHGTVTVTVPKSQASP